MLLERATLRLHKFRGVSDGAMTIECGAAFAPVAGGVLTLTGDFPAGVSAAEQVVAGTVDVVAARDEARGVVTPLAEAFLVRDGRIVTLPLPQDAVGRSQPPVVSGGGHSRSPASNAIASA